MKKGIIASAVLATSVLLTSCIDPSDDNSAVLQNALKYHYPFGLGVGAQVVGINQADISGFENAGGTTPTQVTVTYSGGAAAARTAGCSIPDAFGNPISTPGLAATSKSYAYSTNFDSLLGALDCETVSPGSYSADVKISFTAGGKNYTAKTTLNATVS